VSTALARERRRADALAGDAVAVHDQKQVSASSVSVITDAASLRDVEAQTSPIAAAVNIEPSAPPEPQFAPRDVELAEELAQAVLELNTLRQQLSRLQLRAEQTESQKQELEASLLAAQQDAAAARAMRIIAPPAVEMPSEPAPRVLEAHVDRWAAAAAPAADNPVPSSAQQQLSSSVSADSVDSSVSSRHGASRRHSAMQASSLQSVRAGSHDAPAADAAVLAQLSSSLQQQQMLADQLRAGTELLLHIAMLPLPDRALKLATICFALYFRSLCTGPGATA